MNKPLSPLVLRILRLDHEGLSIGDIASTVKMNREEVAKVLSNYRVRYIIALLGDQGTQLVKDATEGMHRKDIAIKYRIRTIVADAVSKKYYIVGDVVNKRCQQCNHMFKTYVHIRKCPSCGFVN